MTEIQAAGSRGERTVILPFTGFNHRPTKAEREAIIRVRKISERAKRGALRRS